MLSLKVPTDPAWSTAAMGDVGALLVDHAHCEIKAASNALSLAARLASDPEIARILTDIAREEIDHFQRVLALVTARRLALGPPPVDRYAADLRRASQDLAAPGAATPIVDRLLVAALIEARSCERFKLLADATAGEPSLGDVHALWSDLLGSEARHHRAFVDLAVRVAGGDRELVRARSDWIAQKEGDIVVSLASPESGGSRASIHG